MSHGNNQIQIVDLADNVNAAVDKINENFELVETGTFSSVDSSSVTNIVNNILDSDYFTTIINEDYINNITTNLNVDLTDVEAGIAANASAISSLTTSITNIDGTLTILASDVTSLSTSLTDTQAGITANSTAIASLTSSITQTENSLTILAQDVVDLETTFTGDITIDSDLVVSVLANSTAFSGLESSIEVVDNRVTVQSSDIVNLSNEISIVDSDNKVLISAEGDARSELTSRVEVNEGNISTVQGDITILEGKIDTVDSDGNPTTFVALATESLQAEVSRVEGLITTNASWGIDLVAGTEANPHIAGIKFGNDGATAEFALTADTFKIINASDNEIQPFAISGDQIELSNVKVTGNLDIGANLSGARMEMKDDVTKIFDSAGQLRVQLGNLAV
jgi:prefoldin subunit 5